MQRRLHLIYILGLGDHRGHRQDRAVSLWKWWGVEAEIYRMQWHDAEPWEQKLQKLLKHIDQLTKAGNDVALVGASAGGTAAISAFAARQDRLLGVVLICGKINNPGNIGQRYHTRYKAFVAAANAAPQALATIKMSERSRILSRYAIYDPIVPKKDSIIPGASNQTSPTLGHVLTIAIQITIGTPGFVRFLKKLKA